MKYQVLHVPVLFAEAATVELNQFLAAHKIVSVEKEFVADGQNSFWTFCINWVENDGFLAKPTKQKNRIDYREVLNDDDFSVYVKLRELRKSIAEQEGVPAYQVFTNEQLAAIVQQKISSKTELAKLEGIGKKRIEKYAQVFIETLVTLTSEGEQSEAGSHQSGADSSN